MRLAAVVLVLSIACTAHAQRRACDGIVAGLSTMPDELPAVHGPPELTIGRRAAIEALSVTDPDRARQLFELAESYRALGRLGDEVRTLALILQDHPHASSADRVHYRLARALGMQGHDDQARTVWMHLVRDFPTSDYTQAAYVSFGEHYASEGGLAAAQQFYERAVQFPGGRWLAYARYRLAWTLARQGDRTALSVFAQVPPALAGSAQLGSDVIRLAVNGDQAALSAAIASCAPP